MKKYLLSALLLGAAVAASAQTKSAPTSISVDVVSGEIQVSDEGARASAGQATVTWRLVASGYRFSNDSIDFGSASGQFSCNTFNNGASITCNKSGAASGRYPYKIKLVDERSMLVQLPQPYIFIQND